MQTKNDRLEKLKEICLQCYNCPLGETRKKLVFGEGNPDARVLFLGEAPGRNEDETGRPFVGRAGTLLRAMIQAVDLLEDCYIANIAKCRPPNNRPPERGEIDTCIKFLKKQIEIISPKLIVLLGRTAVKGLLPEHVKTPLDSLRTLSKDGVLIYESVPLLITYHPSALLRDPSRKIGASEDFKYLQSIIPSLKIEPHGATIK